jgi:hypothetical protein
MASLKNKIDAHDVWCVNMGACDNDEMLVVAGYDTGDLRVMDLRMGQAVFEVNLQHGICSAEMCRHRGPGALSSLSSLVATTLEGSMHIFDLVDGQFKTTGGTGAGSSESKMTEELVSVQSGDDSTLWQIRHVPQRPGTFAVTDGGGYLHL